jgi:peptidoglycan-associated lipoprotein
MNIKILGAFAAVALLAACSSSETPTPAPAAPVSTGPVPGSQEDLVANVGDRIFFDFDKYSVAGGRGTLTQNNSAVMDRQAAWLAKFPQNNIQVAGNTDERGTAEYNLALGQRRANAARDYLVAKGVATGRVTTISYGKERPVALGSNEEAWAQNRNAITSVR